MVEPSLGGYGRRKRTGIKDTAELDGRLWADCPVTVGDREGNADFSTTYEGTLKPIASVNRCMADRVLSAHRANDLSGEVLARLQDSPISRETNGNGLAEGRCHGSENRDNR